MFNIFGSGRYSKEGPGVYEDTPRKKGIGRFFEILGRDFTGFWLSGMVTLIVYVPTILFVAVGATSGAVLITLFGGTIGGLIGGPFYACLFDTILRAQRDEPGYWFNRYRKAFKNNWKGALLPGAVFGLLLTMQLLSFVVFAPEYGSVVFLASLFISILLTLFLSIWYFAQLVLFDMPTLQLIKNSALLSFSKLPRTFGAAFFMALYWLLMLLYLPLSTAVLLFTNFWFPVFLALSCIYPALESVFNIEEKLKAKLDEELFGE